MAVSNGECDVHELRYHEKIWEVQRVVRRNKRESIFALVRKAEAEHNDSKTVYRITKDLAYGHNSIDAPVRDVSD